MAPTVMQVTSERVSGMLRLCATDEKAHRARQSASFGLLIKSAPESGKTSKRMRNASAGMSRTGIPRGAKREEEVQNN
jgi:hypothetical protein